MANDINIELQKSKLEEAIIKIDEIIKDLEVEVGILENTEEEIKTEISGEMRDALLSSTAVNKLSYMESLSNVFALKKVVQDYLDIICTNKDVCTAHYDGSSSIVTNTQLIYDQINILDEKLNDNQTVQNIIENDPTFQSWVEAYEGTLGDVGLIKKGYKVDLDGKIETKDDDVNFFDKDEDELIFNANKEVVDKMNIELTNSFIKTNALVDTVQVEAGILSGILNNLFDIWNAFEFNQQDYENYAKAIAVSDEDIESIVGKINDEVNAKTGFTSKAVDMLKIAEGDPPEHVQCDGGNGSKPYLYGDLDGNGEINGGDEEVLWDGVYTFGHGMAFKSKQDGYGGDHLLGDLDDDLIYGYVPQD